MEPTDPLAGADLPPVDVEVDAALDRTRARGGRRQRQRAAVLVAAAVGALVVAAVAVAATRDGDRTGVVVDAGPERVEAPPAPHVCDAPEGSPIDVAHEPDTRRNADYSDVVDDDGCLVRIDVVSERPGVDHCGWEATRVLTAGDPFGTSHTTHGVRYVRDPDGLYGDPDLAAGFRADADLPAGAEPSGYWIEDHAIWIDPDDPSAVWVVAPDAVVERWPRGRTPICN